MSSKREHVKQFAACGPCRFVVIKLEPLLFQCTVHCLVVEGIAFPHNAFMKNFVALVQFLRKASVLTGGSPVFKLDSRLKHIPPALQLH